MSLRETASDSAAHDAGRRQSVPKTLLVTWTPPGDRNVGEIILRDLANLFPEGSLEVCEVSNFPAPAAGRSWHHLHAPDERAWRPFAGKAGSLLNHVRVRWVLAAAARRIAREIQRIATEEHIERIWITLNSQTLIRVAGLLKELLKQPLFSIVWDPAKFLAAHQGWDAMSIAWAGRNFDRAMAATGSAMVVSQSMVDEYSRRYGVRCSIVRHAFDLDDHAGFAVPEASACIRIGFAGTLYDTQQLACLVQALAAREWKLGGRPVRLLIIGNYYRFNMLTSPAHVELLGWRSTEDTRQLLAACDFAYLPIPFGQHFSEFATFAFPTKLSTYLAAGCPVLLHAPEGADVARFVRENDVGIVCPSMDASVLATCLDQIQRKASQPALRQNVTRASREYFSRAAMRSGFADFLDVDPGSLRQ